MITLDQMTHYLDACAHEFESRRSAQPDVWDYLLIKRIYREALLDPVLQEAEKRMGVFQMIEDSDESEFVFMPEDEYRQLLLQVMQDTNWQPGPVLLSWVSSMEEWLNRANGHT